MKKRILVAPLNWGLGHATRCIPIIKALVAHGFEPIIASDGVALALLRKELPGFTFVELPSYNVTYAKKGKHFKLKMVKDSPKLLKAIKAEKKAVKTIINTYDITGVISDNRLGVYNKALPCVFITHQLQVLSGSTTWLSTKLHEKFIKRFDQCWVPDTDAPINLSGKLGHNPGLSMNLKYLGPISRFTKLNIPLTIDLLVLLSGPEPQRTMLETRLLDEVKLFFGNVTFVRGVPEEHQNIRQEGNATIYNFMTTEKLEKTINQSRIVLCRSGYTTVMDLAALEKKAFFIPTPGQTEQEYLAKRLAELKLAPCCQQDDFKIALLDQVSNYSGLSKFSTAIDYEALFSLF